MRYCGLNLNIIAADNRPEWLFDKLFCSNPAPGPETAPTPAPPGHFPEFKRSGVVKHQLVCASSAGIHLLFI